MIFKKERKKETYPHSSPYKLNGKYTFKHTNMIDVRILIMCNK